MKMNGKWKGWMAATAFLVAGSVAFAQDKKPTDKPADKPAAKPAEKPAAKPTESAAKPADAKPSDKSAQGEAKSAAGQPSQEEMAKWMAFATPGPEHMMLKPLVGTFSCDIKMQQDPAAPPMTTTGTVTRKSIFDDRYITEDVESNWMGMPFHGHGLMGYDNGQKKYFTLWIDNMGTGVMHQVGSASGKTLTLEGESWDPMQGKMVWGKSTVDLSNNDKHVFKMYMKDKAGKEFQGFEMTCARKP